MAGLSRALGLSTILAAPLLGVEAARFSRKGSDKTIAGIPVHNYDQVRSGEMAQDWLVMGGAGTTDAELSQLCEASNGACKLVGHPNAGGVPFLELRGTERDLERILKGSSGLKFIEPDVPVQLIPEIDEAQGRGRSQRGLWGLDAIGASKRPSEGKGVHLHIFDTGVRTSHSDFGGRAVATLDMSSGAVVECAAGDANCAQDGQGHGTHCAGTAGGTTYGVAPQATVHSVKVLSDSGGGQLGWTVSALDWLGFRGSRPSVASMSLGASGRWEFMFAAVEAVVNTGIVVVVAAGNSNDDACNYSPAYATAAITVGSTTSSNTRSYFSNYGRCTNIWAPGSTILSAGHTSDTDTEELSGTSMACPAVAGAAAIMLEQGAATPEEVLQKLYDNAWTGGINGLYAGDTNKFLYVGNDGPPAPPAPTPPPATVCKEGSSGPDAYGDCVCDPGYDCWWGDDSGCPYSGTEANGIYHRFYYLPDCVDCLCWEF